MLVSDFLESVENNQLDIVVGLELRRGDDERGRRLFNEEEFFELTAS